MCILEVHPEHMYQRPACNTKKCSAVQNNTELRKHTNSHLQMLEPFDIDHQLLAILCQGEQVNITNAFLFLLQIMPIRMVTLQGMAAGTTYQSPMVFFILSTG